MKTFTLAAMRTIAVTLLLNFISAIAFSQTAPDLKTAERFSILAGGEINATTQVSAENDAGAATTISPNVEAEGREFEGGDCIVTEALADLDAAIQQLEAQSGTQLSSSISNTTLSPGVYDRSGSLDVSGTITLSGNSNSVYVFNVANDLTLTNSAKIELNGVDAHNVYYNVEGETHLEVNSEISGRIICEKKIVCEVGCTGEMTLHSKEDVEIKDGCTIGIERPNPPSIELENASSFALLAGGSISTFELTRIIEGDVGALGSISSDLLTYSNSQRFSGNYCETQKALSSLSTAKKIASSLVGTNINPDLSQLSLSQGIYEINGNATVDKFLTLSGNASSVFIFNISGSLELKADVTIQLVGVLPKNVFWNIGNDVNVGGSFHGIVMANSSITLSPHTRGQFSLLSFDNITTVNSCNITSTDMLKQVTIADISPAIASDVNGTPPTTQGSDCSRSSAAWNYYSAQNTWQLETNFNIDEPVKTVLLNFNIFQNSTGGNNFLNNATDLARLEQIRAWANDLYVHVRGPSDPMVSVCGGSNLCPGCTGDCHLEDTRIRLKVHAVKFFQNDALNTSTDWSDLFDEVVAADPDHSEMMNVYWVEPGGGGAFVPYLPNFTNLNLDMHVVMQGFGTNPAGDWIAAITLAHEVAHNLDLAHTYQGGQPITICVSPTTHWYDDVFGSPFPGNCPHTNNFGADAFVNTPPAVDLITNNLMESNLSMSYLSPKQIGRMHRTLSLKSPRRYVEDCPYNNVDALVVSSDELWDFDIKLYRDLVVETGATLTITCKVNMPNNARVFVKRGAKLILDGGTITSGCSLMWKGIEVWGNSSLPHPTVDQVLSGSYPANANDHGVVILKNGALIEDARDGISTMRRDINFNAVWGYTGGIIIAKESTFSNNRRAVEFMAFDADNISTFEKCTFETTSLLDDPATKPSAFVSLWAVHGVTFRGNTFINSSPSGTFAFDERGMGLLSIDAEYSVEPFCGLVFPCTPNHFEGLYRGIDAASSTDPYSLITINGNEFEDMFQGVLLSGLYFSVVTDNDFEVRPKTNFVPFNPSDMPYGLYLDDCSGYVVEANDFKNIVSSNNCVGTFVRNSRDASNKVHSNRYDGLHSGLIAMDDNDGLNAGDGLQITCNKFTDDGFDIVVLSGDADGDIGLLQGICNTATSPAGNQFSHTCTGNNSDYRVTKNSTQQIYYFHHNDVRTIPEAGCFSDNYVVTSNCSIPFVESDACPLLTTCTGVVCWEGIVIDQNSQLSALQSQVDGGNTENLISSINNNAPLTSGQLKNLLVDASPLSDEVLIALINRSVAPVPPGVLKDVINENAPVTTEVLIHLFDLQDALPAGIFKEIMIASSPLTNLILNKIDNMNPQLPNGVLNNILAHQSEPFVVSDRQQLLWDIASVSSKRDYAFDQMIRSQLADEPNGLVNTIALLESEGTVSSKRKLVSAYIKNGDYTNAQQTLNQLSALPEYAEFVQLQNVIIDIKQNGPNQNVFDLTGSNEQTVRDVADQDGEIGAVNAQAMLELVFNEDFNEKFDFADNIQAKMSGIDNTDETPKQTIEPEKSIVNDVGLVGYSLENYPNPFYDGTVIEAYIPGDYPGSEVIVFDLMGHIINRYELDPGHNFIKISSDKLKHGIYFYSLRVDGYKVETKKMVHIK